MGFIRRFTSTQPLDVYEQIEGIDIIDLPPPGQVQGVGTGVVALVGEFADVTFGVSVDANGNVNTFPQPTQVFTSQDLQNAGGGFDETIGDFGNSGGSGFVALRNKSFAALVIVPVNIASSKGTRLWRDLPSNTSTSDTTQVAILQAASVPAGYQFQNTGDRVRSAQARAFTAVGPYATGVDGAVTGGTGVTVTLNSAGAHFLTAKAGGPVEKGDAVMLGVYGAGGALGSNAFTYRVAADASSDTALTLEKHDGSSFTAVSGTALPYRVHPSTDADTGGDAADADQGGFNVPARPLDATISAGTVCTPTVAPPAATGTTWDPLSGLALQTMTGSGGALVFTSAVQAPNAVSSNALDALYSTAIDSLLGQNQPQRDVNIVFAARHSTLIANKLKTHVDTASSQGLGRTAPSSPPLSVQTTANAISDSAPGVGANRDDRIDYCWPGGTTFIPEAVGFALSGADGSTVTDGTLDTHGDGWMASDLSQLAPERNPGQLTPPATTALAPILNIQRGVSGLQMADYIQMKAKGIAGIIFERSVGGYVFQSGVTSSLTPGLKNIARRRMADYIQDSLADALAPFAKQPLTQDLMDSETAEVTAFLDQLLSPNNPPAQRIVGYTVDDKSGNTSDQLAAGVFVIIVKVRTLASQDAIVLQTEIGETVTVTVVAPGATT